MPAVLCTPSPQFTIKACFDQQTVQQKSTPHEELLVSMSVPCSTSRGKFSGPCDICKKSNDVKFAVSTHHRKEQQVSYKHAEGL